ncbi:hypothetical protein X772_17080 [Mesorhizobium sp. LSJC280B00]|nr:hypothetical protein X772_17080 [Mesorhizobium sp. LSJC280B00]
MTAILLFTGEMPSFGKEGSTRGLPVDAPDQTRKAPAEVRRI